MMLYYHNICCITLANGQVLDKLPYFKKFDIQRFSNGIFDDLMRANVSHKSMSYDTAVRKLFEGFCQAATPIVAQTSVISSSVSTKMFMALLSSVILTTTFLTYFSLKSYVASRKETERDF